MRTALHIVFLMATGLAVATIAHRAAPSWLPLEALGYGPRLAGPDYGCLSIGVAVGLILGALRRVRWSELPRRVVAWLLFEWPAFKLVGLGALGAAVLFYLLTSDRSVSSASVMWNQATGSI